MNFIALDSATRKTGYAVFVDSKLKDYGLIEATQDNYHGRILFIREKIIEKIKEFKCEYLVLEEVPMNQLKNLIVAHDLCVCQGVFVGVCCQFDMGLKLYSPTSWRGIMGLFDGTKEGKKREALKEKAVGMVNQIYNLDFEYYKSDSKKHISDDDICEAILLGLTYLKEQA